MTRQDLPGRDRVYPKRLQQLWARGGRLSPHHHHSRGLVASAEGLPTPRAAETPRPVETCSFWLDAVEVLKDSTELHLASVCLADAELRLEGTNDPIFETLNAQYANMLGGAPPSCILVFLQFSNFFSQLVAISPTLVTFFPDPF